MDDILVMYDAPLGTNPSREIKGKGFLFLQGSCYLGKSYMLELLRSSEEKIMRKGGTFDVLSIQEKDRAKVLALAQRSVINEAMRIQAVIEEANRWGEKEVENIGQAKARDKQVKIHLNKAKRAYEALKHATVVFALVNNVDTMLEALRKSIALEMSANELSREIKRSHEKILPQLALFPEI